MIDLFGVYLPKKSDKLLRNYTITRVYLDRDSHKLQIKSEDAEELIGKIENSHPIEKTMHLC